MRNEGMRNGLGNQLPPEAVSYLRNFKCRSLDSLRSLGMTHHPALTRSLVSNEHGVRVG